MTCHWVKAVKMVKKFHCTKVGFYVGAIEKTWMVSELEKYLLAEGRLPVNLGGAFGHVICRAAYHKNFNLLR